MYVEYKPLSKKPDSSTFVPPELSQAQQQAVSKIEPAIVQDWDNWVAARLQLPREHLWEYFSSEQIDSIGLAVFNFERGKNFIIADETGIGKGRILSGISRWAWKQGMKVLFFTEREHLMSEFWKDLHDTNNIIELKNPVAFHSKSKIFNPDGTIALKGTVKLVKTIEEQGFADDTNLVMTNYSQISLKQHKKNKKEALATYCENAIIIMDESHNATGDSNTKNMLMQLTQKARNIVFSSATFIKDESQLDIYQKSIDLAEETIELLKKLLKSGHNSTLRKIFTYELTRNLQFWRREHQPLDVGWQTVTCENAQHDQQILQQYSEIINGLFGIVNDINKDPSLESQMVASAWFALGATINRLSRNLLLVLKLQILVEAVSKSIANNHKAVIVIDSTLSSMVKKITAKEALWEDNEEESTDTNPDDDTDESHYALNFAQAVLYVIEEVLGEVIHLQGMDGELFSRYEELREKCSVFSNLSISPIDTIVNLLADQGIKCGEISGRTFCLNRQGHIEKLQKQAKTHIVRQFNSGELDAVIITRAGASGISLHASAAFKDKRVRDLYELEITNRPTYRLQFIGRVNRKNQVAQPLFFTVVTKLPFEQRILNVEQRKLKTLQSHISGDDEKLGQENVYNFYNPHTEQSAYVFLLNHPQLAYQMGISLKNKKNDFYYIDSLLKRCIVLSVEQQNYLYDYLIYTVESYKKLQLRKNVPESIEMDSIQTFWHQLDKPSQEQFRLSYGMQPQESINQFKFAWVGLMKTNATYSSHEVREDKLKQELQANLAHEVVIAKHLARTIQTIAARQKYNEQFVKDTVVPVLNSLRLGLCVTIQRNEGRIYGYVHDIIIPPMAQAHKYESLTLVHIKTINPHLHHSIHYANEDYYLTLDELIESESISLHDKPIEWSKFNRPQQSFVRSNYCLVGHPVYMQFLQQAYQLGDIEYYNFHDKNQMCIVFPASMSAKDILSLKKPIYQTNKIMQGLIAKQFSSLTTIWQSEDIVKPSLKLEPTTGGYNLYISQEVVRNYDMIDFALKKRLKDFRGVSKGFHLYFFSFKDIRTLLWMLEQRDVIWFVNH